MAFIIDTINGSGLYAQSAASASVATYDSNGNVITATYLTGVDLTPYQTTAGMTAYATTGDVANKLDTTAFSDVSGTFLTAHQSLDGYATTAWVDSQGYLTAHQPISADEWNDVYDTVNVYSGSWTGSETSPTASVDSNGSIDIVSSNNTVYFDVNGTWFNNAVNSALPTSATQWNSNYETVNTNSGVWGGSALNISAGEGVKVTLVNNNLVFSTDETVLYSGDVVVNESNTFNLSESLFNFGSIKIYDKSINGNAVPLRVTEISFRDNTQTFRFGTNDVWIDGWQSSSHASHYQGWNFYSANIEGTTIATMGSWISHMNNSGAPTVRNIGHIYEVVGINRISGGNA